MNRALLEFWTPLSKLSEDFTKEAYEEGNGLCLSLLRRALEALQQEDSGQARIHAHEAVELAWERLHSGTSWREVSSATRTAYAIAQLILSGCEAQDNRLDECLRRLDMLLLMGPQGMHAPVNTLVDKVQDVMDEQQQQQRPPPPPASEERAVSPIGGSRKRPRLATEPSPGPHLVIEDSIPRVSQPSLVAFLSQYMRPRQPVILTGCMDDWPAMERQGRQWSDIGYLKRVAGRRTVPVEVGKGTYLTAAWGQRLMRFSDFIDRFLIRQPGQQEEGEGGEEKGYLAQHELFEQIPQLRRDILTPDYCALDDEEEKDGDDGGDDDHVAVNAWFGPGGTVSPTHTDPYHNLLAQVVGSKEVRLFAPTQSDRMYPHAGLMSNNSQVDPKAPDLDRFPRFAQAESVRCVLHAGEMLYIPPFFWHHIESLETSFSVSFWFGKRKAPPPSPAAITAGMSSPSSSPTQEEPPVS